VEARSHLIANRYLLLSVLSTLLFIQSLRAFVASVYYHNLVALSINATVLYTLLLFSPLLYLLPGVDRRLPILMPIFAASLAAMRLAMNVAWGTGLYLPLAGLASASYLLLFPALLHSSRTDGDVGGWVPVALGLALAFSLDIAMSLTGTSRDPSTGLPGLLLTLPIAVFTVYLSVVGRPAEPVAGQGGERGRTAVAGVGLGAWLFVEYALLSNTYLVARWNELPLEATSLAVLFGLIVPVASCIGGRPPLARPWPLLALNVVAFSALLDFALIHSPVLPALLLIAQAAMVLNLLHLVDFLQGGGPRRTATALLYSALTLLLSLFAFAFSLTYAYVPLRSLWEGSEVVLIPGAFLLVAIPAALLSGGFRRLTMPALPKGLVAALLVLPLLLSTLALASVPELQEPTQGRALRVLTYNVHQGFNNDGMVDPDIFVEVLLAADADIVALQESDTVRFTSAGLDLVRYLSERLGYHVFYGPPTREQSFGVALLSRHPIEEASYVGLTSSEDRRAFIKARIQVAGADVWIFVVHLGLEAEDREVQTEEILREASQVRGHRILAGDFNSCPGGLCLGYPGPPDEVYDRVTSFYKDVWVEAGFSPDDPDGNTYPSQRPVKRIDYIFVSIGLRVEGVERIRTEASMRASDHLPVLASLELIL
jgi:endonuclease/exonuclease/phosphatase family metal-dependent hydrolase